MRISSPRGVQTTTINVSKAFMPTVTRRCSLGRSVFDRESERIIQDTVALGERDPVLLKVYRVLLRIERGGRNASICT